MPADAPIGENIREYLCLDDHIIAVDLTPNRGDCLSIQGLAREIAAKNNIALQSLTIKQSTPTLTEIFPVSVIAKNACPNYLGRVIKNINPAVESPFWLKEKLRRSGIRSISAVVDVTNYVMLELGQPLHAFDLAKIKNTITVRFAKPRIETIELLNQTTVELKENTLVIADDNGAIAIAGIMGGIASSCTTETTELFLESALFMPEFIAGKARQYALHTDSSIDLNVESIQRFKLKQLNEPQNYY